MELRKQTAEKRPFLNNLFILIGFFLIALLIVSKSLFAVFLIGLAVLIWALSHRLDIGWYVLVALSLIPHWVFRFDDYWWFFTEYPKLLAINAPVVDFWTVIVFLAFALSRIRAWLRGEGKRIIFPGGVWALLFLISALASVVNLPSYEVSKGLWFFVRFLLLFYLGYLLLGTNILQTQKQVRTSLAILATVGLAAAFMGAIGFLFHFWEGGILPRAVPFALWGWTPFGFQHVFLAEAMTVTLPIWVYLWAEEKDAETKMWLGRGVLFIALVALLTFSRAGWITLLVCALVAYILLRKHIPFKLALKKYRWIGICAAVLTALFVLFMLTTRDVYTSTLARYELTEIATVLFVQHPILGQGVGSFSDRAQELLVFHWEIGGVQDAHGLIQKLLSEQGLFGLVTFVGMIVALLSMIYRQYLRTQPGTAERHMVVLALLLVVAPFTFQLFNTHIYSSKVWVPVAIACAIARGMKKEV